MALTYDATPLYIQLKKTLLDSIASGSLKPGDMLPTELSLQQTYSMSRTTVRAALKELEYEGVIVRMPGKGTFVAPERIMAMPRKLMSYSDEMRSYGLHPSNRVLSLKKVDPPGPVAASLCLTGGEQVWHVERLKLANGTPMALDDSYFPVKLARSITAGQLEAGSLYQYFTEELGIRLSGARETLSARRPTPAQARLLQISQEVPLFVVERITLTGESEAPVEAVTTSFRSDRYTYRVKL